MVGQLWYRPGVPFAYYQKLSRRARATYDASDALPPVKLRNPAALRELATQLERVLSTGDQRAIGAALRTLARCILSDLGAPPVKAIVLARRPSSAAAELHGLYSYSEGETPEIRVWMRTAAHSRVVRFRTFLRTFLHELCHHLDLKLFGLPDSYHTEGFFKRESSLMRQLAPPEQKPAQQKTAKRSAKTKSAQAKPAKSSATTKSAKKPTRSEASKRPARTPTNREPAKKLTKSSATTKSAKKPTRSEVSNRPARTPTNREPAKKPTKSSAISKSAKKRTRSEVSKRPTTTSTNREPAKRAATTTSTKKPDRSESSKKSVRSSAKRESAKVPAKGGSAKHKEKRARPAQLELF